MFSVPAAISLAIVLHVHCGFANNGYYVRLESVRDVVSLKPATKDLSQKTVVVVFFAAAAAAAVVVLLVVWNPAEERGCNCTTSKWS